MQARLQATVRDRAAFAETFTQLRVTRGDARVRNCELIKRDLSVRSRRFAVFVLLCVSGRVCERKMRDDDGGHHHRIGGMRLLSRVTVVCSFSGIINSSSSSSSAQQRATPCNPKHFSLAIFLRAHARGQ